MSEEIEHIDPGVKLKELIAVKTLRNIYWGYLFSRVRRKAATGFGSIMGVAGEKDGTISLLYEPNLVSVTSEKDLALLLEHEGMHLINLHLPRLVRILANELGDERKAQCSNVWNVAADCASNEQAGLPEKFFIGDEEVEFLYPKKFGLPNKHATEYYYYKLWKDNVKMIEISYVSDKNCKNHKNWIPDNVEGTDMFALSRKMDNFSKDIIKESVKNFNKSRGTLPYGLEELIKEALRSPQVPYYQIIRKLVRASRLSKFRRSPTKINRKRTYLFSIGNKNVPQLSPFPGRTRDFTFNIALLLDTSGSMDKDDILEGLSGVKDLIEKDRHCTLNVIECDAAVEKVYQVKRLNDIQFNVKGRGGTELFPGLEKCKEFSPDVTLAFTDGHCEDINKISRRLLPKKIIWVITKGGNKNNVNRTGFVVELEK